MRESLRAKEWRPEERFYGGFEKARRREHDHRRPDDLISLTKLFRRRLPGMPSHILVLYSTWNGGEVGILLLLSLGWIGLWLAPVVAPVVALVREL